MESVVPSLRKHLDALPSKLKKTGVATTVEIVAYPDGHAAISGLPLNKPPANGKPELEKAITYLYERLHREAVEAASS